jgi:hypothetical protein
MPEPVLVSNLAGLPLTEFEPLQTQLSQLHSMLRVLKWLESFQPALRPDDLIPQDEFSYDLLVPLPDGLYLSYDTS